MKNILEEMLIRKIGELKGQGIHGQKILNIVKGDLLHLMTLNFLYSHKTYKNCVMYGGSALRLIYDLPRMSVDLDFQINFTLNGERFKSEITQYFKDKYGYEKLEVGLGSEAKDTMVVRIMFSGLDKFKIPDLNFTKLKVRLDFNKFDTDAFQQVLVPQRNEYNDFHLRTYPLSTLMASKIVALFSRVQYEIPVDSGQSLSADYKGRDIYDLIWYLQEGAIPNLRYLEQKGHSYQDYPSLFKKIKERLSHLSDGGKALRADLTHLYLQPSELDEWMDKWHERFLGHMQKNYSPIKIRGLNLVRVMQNFNTDHFTFIYDFDTDQHPKARFSVVVSENYIEDFSISGHKRNDLSPKIASEIDTDEDVIKEYAGLFYSKIEDFLKRVGGISPRLKVQTKLILYSGDYAPETMIVFTNKELEACQFEDLL